MHDAATRNARHIVDTVFGVSDRAGDQQTEQRESLTAPVCCTCADMTPYENVLAHRHCVYWHGHNDDAGVRSVKCS